MRRRAFDEKSRSSDSVSMQIVNASKHRAGLETLYAGADPAFRWGRPPSMEECERTASVGPAGVLVMTCMHKKALVTREAPAVIRSWDQPATRESKAGPFGVTV